jgi:hypothetical protein
MSIISWSRDMMRSIRNSSMSNRDFSNSRDWGKLLQIPHGERALVNDGIEAVNWVSRIRDCPQRLHN